MPLAKKKTVSKGNQGNQWGDTGPEGNIHTVVNKHQRKGAVSTKRGRNKSIGR